jgi:hypothetical protein
VDHKRRIPHEGVKNNGDGLAVDGARVEGDDTEGHLVFMDADGVTVSPGTGGDIAPRRPSTGGEFIDENDVEGHVVFSTADGVTVDGVTVDGLTVNPGTGGDFSPRRPSTGGEFIDENDVEGHVV